MTPQQTYNVMSAVGTVKIRKPFPSQVLQGFMAGAYVGIGALFANLMEAGFQTGPPALPNLVGGAVFPIGLIAINLTGANLFTGNCMYVVPPFLTGTVSRLRVGLFLLTSWFSNFLGAMFVAYFIAYLGEWTNEDPVQSFVQANAMKKINLSWHVAFLRGIGANWLVCLAWWQALSARDTVSKIIGVWLPVFAFTAIGFEHSIANMFYVDIGLLEGADASFWQFVWNNLVPVTLGNFVGGAVFVGLSSHLTYYSDDGYVSLLEASETMSGEQLSKVGSIMDSQVGSVLTVNSAHGGSTTGVQTGRGARVRSFSRDDGYA